MQERNSNCIGRTNRQFLYFLEVLLIILDKKTAKYDVLSTFSPKIIGACLSVLKLDGDSKCSWVLSTALKTDLIAENESQKNHRGNGDYSTSSTN